MIVVPMTVAVSNTSIPMVADHSTVQLPFTTGVECRMVGGPAYTGAYTFTPSDETQTFLTAGFAMTDDITINPIPSNYGLITYNGSTITVS